MDSKLENRDETFRDKLATAEQSGSRIWLFPTKASGKFFNARVLVATILLAFLFTAPFIKISGQPFILLDILDRTFILFGVIFRPADFYLFVLAVLTTIVFVVLFTAIFGRLFCGWICPQTIFMEMVFRRIEYWIDGSPSKQRKLREGPWTAIKVIKRVLKNGVFFAISFLIGNTLLAYIIGVDRLYEIISTPPTEHMAGFLAMLIFSGAFFFIFAWFREQACTLVCPYGRLQGVLIDPQSIAISYDYNRGEPREKFRKNENRDGKGDCISCRACVSSCPTGIDIRNGTQLECVNCTACIDACNKVMDKVGFDRGLIRYSSESKLQGQKYKTPGRVIIYSVVIAALLSLLTILLLTRSEVETTIFRTPGTLSYETDDGWVRNLYSVQMINKTFDQIPISFRLKEPSTGRLTLVGGENVLDPEAIGESAFFVDIHPDQLLGPSQLIIIEVYSGDNLLDEIESSFLGSRIPTGN